MISKKRNLPKAAIEIRPSDVAPTIRRNGKKIHYHMMPFSDFDPFIKFDRCAIALRYEGKIADLIGIEEHDVLIVPPVPVERFIPNDVKIIDGSLELGTLQNARPEHYRGLVESVTAATALRVCVPKKYRSRVAEKHMAEKIILLLLSAQ